MKQAARFRFRASYFDLDLLVHSHGWVQLAPFSWDERDGILSRHEYVNGKLVHLAVEDSGAGAAVSCRCASNLTAPEKKLLRRRCSYMLGLDIDPGPFVRRSRELDRRIHRLARRGGARMLKGSTLFEDVVKTLFTTNASWAFTRQMCHLLVSECNAMTEGGGGPAYFPSCQMVMALGLRALEERCRLGYRAAYLWNIAQAFGADGEIARGGAREILAGLRAVKGLGPYSINHVAVLLGEYGQIPVDSEVRGYCGEIGLACTEEAILKHYSPWHPYEFLAFRLERRIRRATAAGQPL